MLTYMYCNYDNDNKFEFNSNLSLILCHKALAKVEKIVAKCHWQHSGKGKGWCRYFVVSRWDNLGWHQTKMFGHHAIYWIASKIKMFSLQNWAKGREEGGHRGGAELHKNLGELLNRATCQSTSTKDIAIQTNKNSFKLFRCTDKDVSHVAMRSKSWTCL